MRIGLLKMRSALICGGFWSRVVHIGLLTTCKFAPEDTCTKAVHRGVCNSCSCRWSSSLTLIASNLVQMPRAPVFHKVVVGWVKLGASLDMFWAIVGHI